MIKISTAFTISITAYKIPLQYFSNVTERESLQGLWRLCPPQYIIQCSKSNENVQNNGVKKYEHIYYKLILYAKIKIIDLHSDIWSLKVQQLWSDPKCKYDIRSKWSAFISSPFQMIIGQQMYLTQSFNKALFYFIRVIPADRFLSGVTKTSWNVKFTVVHFLLGKWTKKTVLLKTSSFIRKHWTENRVKWFHRQCP